jgi:hypothetical protein
MTRKSAAWACAADRHAGRRAGAPALLHRGRADGDAGRHRPQGQGRAARHLHRARGAFGAGAAGAERAASGGRFHRRPAPLQAEVAARGRSDGDYDVPYTTCMPARCRAGCRSTSCRTMRRVDFEIRSLAGEDVEALIGGCAPAAEAIVAPLRAEFPEAAITVERLWDYPGLGTPSEAAWCASSRADRGEWHDQGGLRHRGRAVSMRALAFPP